MECGLGDAYDAGVRSVQLTRAEMCAALLLGLTVAGCNAILDNDSRVLVAPRDACATCDDSEVEPPPEDDAGSGEPTLPDAGSGEPKPVDAGGGELDAGSGKLDAGSGEVDAGSGGPIDPPPPPCAASPCVRGTCRNVDAGFRCDCPSGWAGERCEAGTCSTVSCAPTAPCRVPTGGPGICFPNACAGKPGLCLAQRPDGGGAASTEPLTEINPTFNFGPKNDWNNRSRYFSYLVPVSNLTHVCVYPQLNLGGTPIVLALGEAATTPAPFGQSNAFSDMEACARFIY